MNNNKVAISSISLGRAASGHALTDRLREARRHGYQGIEIFHEEIIHLSSSMPGGGSSLPDNQLAAASIIKAQCDAANMPVASLQPFMHFEGLADREGYLERLGELTVWLGMAKRLCTDLILIPSTFLPAEETTGRLAVIVSDLTAAADTAASVGVKIAYEALCWGTHVDSWEQSWEIVKLVNRPNFGLGLDTFNIGGKFADPASPSGFVPNWECGFERSMERMRTEVDVGKLFLVQLVDAARLDRPLVEGHELFRPEQPARMSWARNRRLFYGERERGAYLPVRRICEVIFRDLGYEGWVSFELFHERLWAKDEGIPEEMAHRGMDCWGKVVRDMDRGRVVLQGML